MSSFCFDFVQNDQILHIVIKHFYEYDIDNKKEEYYNYSMKAMKGSDVFLAFQRAVGQKVTGARR